MGCRLKSELLFLMLLYIIFAYSAFSAVFDGITQGDIVLMAIPVPGIIAQLALCGCIIAIFLKKKWGWYGLLLGNVVLIIMALVFIDVKVGFSQCGLRLFFLAPIGWELQKIWDQME